MSTRFSPIHIAAVGTKSLWVLVAFFLSLWSANADIIAAWDFNGVDVADGTGLDAAGSPYLMSAGTTLAGLDTAALTLGTVNPSTAGSTYGFKISTGSESASLSEAITANHYIQFSLSATAGHLMNLSSLDLFGESSGTGADDVAIMSNIAGFTSGSELDSVTGIAGVTGGLDTDTSGFGAPIDLTSPAYQGISSVTFRLYGYNTGSTTGSTSLRSISGDDLVINGTLQSVVPEPSTLALFLIAISGVTLHRRKIRAYQPKSGS